ncbi:hypothetical protein BALOs_0492 [Halobacteriovorax sp. BALOs_7]|uniref:hypothetical protein n=1 Tax=unclassified Halobacteriovorax TaxID=2639665 RepID=UPI000EA03B04|nr:hypothetical protein [Halobacteriovorax sp. BALOs_7]AYF43504.1 hypothetical protein BALOs_0492 [Halobacteriovorax sp. BALOs_7]
MNVSYSLSLEGVEYIPDFIKTPPSTCDKITQFEFNLIYAFTTSELKSDEKPWVEFQAKCQHLFYPDIVIKSYVESRSDKPVLEFEEALKMKFDSKKVAHQNFLKSLERKNIHQLLLEIIIASSLNKNEWLTTVIIDLLGRDITNYSVWINENIIPKSRQKYAKYINRTFELVNESSIDEFYKLMFFKKFTHISTGDSRLKLTQLLNQTFGATLEFDITSYKYGVKMTPFWVQELENFNEKKRLVERFFATPAVKELSDYNGLLFEYNLPKVGSGRDKIIDKIASEYKDYNFDKMMSLISGLRNPVFKKELVKRDKYFERPIFSIERTFLNKKLREKKSSWLAYQLLYLGQRNEEIIKNLMVDL